MKSPSDIRREHAKANGLHERDVTVIVCIKPREEVIIYENRGLGWRRFQGK